MCVITCGDGPSRCRSGGHLEVLAIARRIPAISKRRSVSLRNMSIFHKGAGYVRYDVTTDLVLMGPVEISRFWNLPAQFQVTLAPRVLDIPREFGQLPPRGGPDGRTKSVTGGSGGWRVGSLPSVS